MSHLFPTKVWNLLSELAPHQTLEILPILAHQAALTTLGEGTNTKGGNSSSRTLQVEHVRLVSTCGSSIIARIKQFQMG